MKGSFACTWLQTKFLIRRERKRMLLWIIISLGFCAMSLGNILASYPDQKSLDDIFVTMQMPMIKLLFGNFRYELPNTEIYEFVAETFMILIVIVVLMNIFLAVRFSRKQEENGTTELVLTSAAGRFSPLVAAYIAMSINNIIVGLGSFLIVAASGFKGGTAKGHLIFALLIFVIGFLFQNIALLASQIASDSSSATMLSFIVFGGCFVIRMYLDMERPDAQIFSPLSWGGAGQPYGDNNWMPIITGVGVSLLLTVLAFLCVKLRDVGAGILPATKGRAAASRLLRGPITLRVKTDKKVIIIWTVTMIIFGIMFGTLLDSIGDLAENPLFAKILGAGGGQLETVLIKSLAALLAVMFAVTSVLPGIGISYQMKKDQFSGSLELFYPSGISRDRIFLSYQLVGLIVTIFLSFVSIMSIWFGGKIFEVPNIEGSLYIKSFLNLVPYVSFIFSFAPFLYVFLQKFTGVLYAYIGFSFFTLIIGDMFDLPEWLNKIAIFGLLKKVPSEEIDWGMWWALTVIALLIFIVSFIGYRRKDIRAVE